MAILNKTKIYINEYELIFTKHPILPKEKCDPRCDLNPHLSHSGYPKESGIENFQFHKFNLCGN